MNHIKNQSGDKIIAVGSEGSFIRIKEQYNITVNKLIEFINRIYLQGGINRHADYLELLCICQDTNVLEKDAQRNCIRTAYFYSDAKNDNFLM